MVAVPISRLPGGAGSERRAAANGACLPTGCIACSAASPVQLPALQLGGSHLGGSLNGRLVGILEGQQRLHSPAAARLPV